MTTDNQSLLNKARKDKFILVLDIPKAMKDINSSTVRSKNFVNLDKLQFSVAGTIVPEIVIPSVSTATYGQTFKFTSQKREPYAPITINFNIDNNFENYWILWKWLAILNDPLISGMPKQFAEFVKTNENLSDKARENGLKTISNLWKNKIINKEVEYTNVKMVNDYMDYQTTITIYGLREYNEAIIKFHYYGAFITNLNRFDYNYKDSEEISCNFTFEFSQMDITILDQPVVLAELS